MKYIIQEFLKVLIWIVIKSLFGYSSIYNFIFKNVLASKLYEHIMFVSHNDDVIISHD